MVTLSTAHRPILFEGKKITTSLFPNDRERGTTSTFKDRVKMF
jgi:hypothetical protein